MAKVQVTSKQADIDGKPIQWNVLSIIGYAGGELQTLELKLSKTEAMLARILLSNDEEKPVEHTRKSNLDERKQFNENIKRESKLNLDSDDEPNEALWD